MSLSSFQRRRRELAKKKLSDPSKMDLDELKALATDLGIKFNARIGKDKLSAKLKEHGKSEAGQE